MLDTPDTLVDAALAALRPTMEAIALAGYDAGRNYLTGEPDPAAIVTAVLQREVPQT